MKTRIIIGALLIFATISLSKAGETSDADSAFDGEILKAIQSNRNDLFQDLMKQGGENRRQLGESLLNILRDAKSSNFQKCAAAYCLGEIHSEEASGLLATNIALELDVIRLRVKHLIKIEDALKVPAVASLKKIGTPCIPSLIQNLSESDDAKVQELSLKVLCDIEKDKDVVQLRLEKAMRGESDSKRQERLQNVLKRLGETK